MTDNNDPSEALMTAVSALLGRNPELTPIQAAVLAACGLGIAEDSRSFANRLCIEHAIVLREAGELAEATGLLLLGKQDARTMRQWYSLSASGKALLQEEGIPVR